ncbi:MAG TPA: hypothetical protein VKT75_17315 [Acidobacteriaceae bacterium]|nr:hypothetical protein [Acidobacteriaceae bacterium]
MDVGREALLVGDALQQVVEAAALVLGEGGEQGGLVLAGDLADGGEHPAAVGGEVEGVAAAVILITAALDEAAALKGVEQGDEAAGHHLKTAGQGLLGDAGAGAEDAQDAGMGRRESDGEQALGETRGGVAADLSEQEGGVGASDGFGARGFFHRIIITYENRSTRELF